MLGKSLTLSELQFPHVYDGNNSSKYYMFAQMIK